MIELTISRQVITYQRKRQFNPAMIKQITWVEWPPPHSVVTFIDGDSVSVEETPDEIAALMKPGKRRG